MIEDVINVEITDSDTIEVTLDSAVIPSSILEHIADDTIHVTQENKDYWDAKVGEPIILDCGIFL